jgi:hypothetical protein
MVGDIDFVVLPPYFSERCVMHSVTLIRIRLLDITNNESIVPVLKQKIDSAMTNSCIHW